MGWHGECQNVGCAPDIRGDCRISNNLRATCIQTTSGNSHDFLPQPLPRPLSQPPLLIALQAGQVSAFQEVSGERKGDVVGSDLPVECEGALPGHGLDGFAPAGLVGHLAQGGITPAGQPPPLAHAQKRAGGDATNAKLQLGRHDVQANPTLADRGQLPPAAMPRARAWHTCCAGRASAAPCGPSGPRRRRCRSSSGHPARHACAGRA